MVAKHVCNIAHNLVKILLSLFLLWSNEKLGWLSIDAVWGRTAVLKNGVRFPRTIL